MKKTRPSIPEEKKSDALKNFEKNLDDVMAFIKRMNANELHKAAQKMDRAIRKQLEVAPKKNLKKLEKAIGDFTVVNDEWLAFYRPACRWLIVMLVSFLESYLEDVLIEVGKRNPKIIREVPVELRSIFESASLDTLRADIRRQWAHNSLRPNGPITWRRTLRDLGAPEIRDGVVDELQHMWNTRNLIVHDRGTADAAYTKKYANRGVEVGKQINVNINLIGRWLAPTKEFVEWADAFCLAYATSKEEGMRREG